MKKILVLLLVVSVLSALFFIQIPQQKTIVVKGSFFNVYGQLANPQNWENWHPDLVKNTSADSNKISIKKDSSAFNINYADSINIKVKITGNRFSVVEDDANKNANYSYMIAPAAQLNNSIISVNKKSNLLKYLAGQIWTDPFADTHINDFKKFMETDSLFYGTKIFKTVVPGNFLVVLRKEVLSKDKFTEANRSFTGLLAFIKTHRLKKTQPVMAQFISKGTDSTQVNIGFFVDKQFDSVKDTTYMRMPLGGPLYASIYSGKFNKRQKAYDGLARFFTDHVYQTAVAPFEMYLNNQLPKSDTEKINIQVNFTAFN